MDSLHHSPCLEELTLTMGHAFRLNTWCYLMPSPEVLEREDSDTQEANGQELPGMPDSNQGHQPTGRRPRYTWDWHLPNLRKLDLAAVFAFLFDFQWLEYLPNLQSLRLNTLSPTSTLHERRITLKDLSRREPRSPPDEYGSSDALLDRYVSLPKLESIELGGRWIFEKNVLEVLCLAVAPNLHRITFGNDCTGYTLEECITLSRKMPLIKKMDLPMLSAGGEIQGMGLVPIGAFQDEQCNKERVTFYLDGGTFCDILGSLAIA
ncbi:MAG: hypothetical protein J3Q66DRAFT_333455 [Benniella sp.]|nr:MAG: hypothetical protein J3Q66DRAFT_333455 [Benniella sp.]